MYTGSAGDATWLLGHGGCGFKLKKYALTSLTFPPINEVQNIIFLHGNVTCGTATTNQRLNNAMEFWDPINNHLTKNCEVREGGREERGERRQYEAV